MAKKKAAEKDKGTGFPIRSGMTTSQPIQEGGSRTAPTKKEHGHPARATTKAKPLAVVDTRVIYCGDNLEQLKKLPEGCVDLI